MIAGFKDLFDPPEISRNAMQRNGKDIEIL
jgi:hypothetical protein